jgi:hypothetical protein
MDLLNEAQTPKHGLGKVWQLGVSGLQYRAECFCGQTSVPCRSYQGAVDRLSLEHIDEMTGRCTDGAECVCRS